MKRDTRKKRRERKLVRLMLALDVDQELLAQIARERSDAWARSAGAPYDCSDIRAEAARRLAAAARK